MPTTYAHCRFGKDVLSCLPLPLRNAVNENRELYDIGLHGPDILFYYRFLTSNHVNRTGSKLHEKPAAGFFLRAKDMLEQAEDKAAGRAYLYGVICHFALDSVCHPYVEKMIHASGLSHSEIEMEFDRFLLTEDHRDPLSYPLAGHIHPSEKNSAVIAPFYEGISAKEVKSSLKEQIRFHKLISAKTARKRKLLFTLMKAAGKYDEFHGLIMSASPNPDCAGYCRLLRGLYAEAVPAAASLIRKYQDFLFENTGLPEQFEKTFGAGDDWEKLPL